MSSDCVVWIAKLSITRRTDPCASSRSEEAELFRAIYAEYMTDTSKPSYRRQQCQEPNLQVVTTARSDSRMRHLSELQRIVKSILTEF